MKAPRIVLRVILLLTVTITIPESMTAMAINPRSGFSCSHCHNDLSTVLPKQHPKISEKKIDACFNCHNSAIFDKDKSPPFLARMHVKHAQPEVNLDCMACHIWRPTSQFGFSGKPCALRKPSPSDLELNRQIFLSWATSSNIDACHAKHHVSCFDCHRKGLPRKGDSVENDTCISCHDSYVDLAQKTKPARFPDRNPHESHLGEIECVVCHRAHKPSEIYCLGCHLQFDMEIKGASHR